jgi:hypothetical protein
MFTDEVAMSVWHQKDKTFYSGFHGPFGGLYSEKNINTHLTSENIKNLLSCLRLKSEKTDQDIDIKIRLFPERIFPNWADRQLGALTTSGFHVDFSDTAHYIMLDRKWRDAWNRNRLRDFKKSVERICGLQIKTNEEILEFYDVITKNADYKNRRFSLSLEDFKRMSSVLSGNDLNLWIYKSTITGDNVAAAICQIVDHRVVYVFRWGHVYNYKDYGLENSPMTFVADQLCQEYSDRGFKILYLGTSSVEGVLDENLSHFKESLGASRTTIESMTLKSLH